MQKNQTDPLEVWDLKEQIQQRREGWNRAKEILDPDIFTDAKEMHRLNGAIDFSFVIERRLEQLPTKMVSYRELEGLLQRQLEFAESNIKDNLPDSDFYKGEKSGLLRALTLLKNITVWNDDGEG